MCTELLKNLKLPITDKKYKSNIIDFNFNQMPELLLILLIHFLYYMHRL